MEWIRKRIVEKMRSISASVSVKSAALFHQVDTSPYSFISPVTLSIVVYRIALFFTVFVRYDANIQAAQTLYQRSIQGLKASIQGLETFKESGCFKDIFA
ncbi:hypothetical protein D3C80_1545400 [compost metagenome]